MPAKRPKRGKRKEPRMICGQTPVDEATKKQRAAAIFARAEMELDEEEEEPKWLA